MGVSLLVKGEGSEDIKRGGVSVRERDRGRSGGTEIKNMGVKGLVQDEGNEREEGVYE